ncbi:hypothetical protein ACFFUE_03190 [Bergeyella porcorum]|uniref:hypothetical protein n=1 Tax=Bergeyella porcorum TaxID=1735111 RepID=UPI0035E4E29E
MLLVAALGVAGLVSASTGIVQKKNTKIEKYLASSSDNCTWIYLSCTFSKKCGAKSLQELIDYWEKAEEAFCGGNK